MAAYVVFTRRRGISVFGLGRSSRVLWEQYEGPEQLTWGSSAALGSAGPVRRNSSMSLNPLRKNEDMWHQNVMRRTGLYVIGKQSRRFCEVASPERLDMLRTRPFLYKVVNILHNKEMVYNLKESLKVWDGYMNELLVGEALKHVTDGHTALAFFNWAAQQDGFKHNGYTYNCLIRALEIANCHSIIYDIFQRMLSIQAALTSFTFDVTLRALGATGELDKLKLVCAEMEQRKISPHPSIYSAVLLCYCTNGEVEDAYDIFTKLTEWPDPICFPHTLYDQFISVLTRTRHLEAAYLVFLEMIDNGYEPNSLTISKLIDALHQAGRQRTAYKIADELVKGFHTHLTGRMGKPGDSLADRYLQRNRQIRKGEQKKIETVRRSYPGYNYSGPCSFPGHCW